VKTCQDCSATLGHYQSLRCRSCAARVREAEIALDMEARAARFWPLVERGGPDECWPWRGFRNQYGYGRFRVHYRRVVAHRVAYELTKGPIPAGLTIDHLCRNRLCVNPAHLEAVTLGTNIRRAIPFRRSAA